MGRGGSVRRDRHLARGGPHDGAGSQEPLDRARSSQRGLAVTGGASVQRTEALAPDHEITASDTREEAFELLWRVCGERLSIRMDLAHQSRQHPARADLQEVRASL